MKPFSAKYFRKHWKIVDAICNIKIVIKLSFISLDSENLGSIRMKVRLTQERILPQKCYQPLVEILVNSASDPESLNPTALSLIEELTAADQATLAHQMVRLFIGQDVVIPFLDYITLREIRKTSEKPYCITFT